MTILMLITISFALSLDAFAVAISCGIKLKHFRLDKFSKIAITFGIFQAGMPLAGWVIGHYISDYIESYAHWISFFVFAVLGTKTLHDAIAQKDESECGNCQCQSIKCLVGLAIATSIDAFIVGVVLSLYKVSLPLTITLIGVITFIMSMVGCLIGNRSAHFLQKKAQYLAGIILFALAIKSLF